MIRRLYAFLLPAVLALSTLEAGAQSQGNVVFSKADQDYRGLYINSGMTSGNSTGSRPGISNPGNIVSSILIPGTMYQAYGGHYLDFLYKQVLCICSLYWLLAGYRRYRPGRISDNNSKPTVKF